MPKKEWGVKRVCPKTGKRFYDLNKDPIVSPYTGEIVELDNGEKSREAFAEKEDEKPETVLADGEEEEVLDDEDDDTVSLDDIADVADESDDD